MNIFDLANYSAPRWQRTWRVRQERIKREGSEYFTWIVPVIAASGRTAIEVNHQFPRAKKYAPLDWMQIVNADTVDLQVTINGNTTLPVPAKTIITNDLLPLWEIRINNLDAANATTLNKIIVTMQRQPLTADALARRHG